MRKNLFAATAAGLLLNGCATVFGPPSDIVTVNAQDKDTKIFINDDYMGKGTASYSVPRGKTIIIAGEKEGCARNMIQSQKTLVGITMLNIFFWPGFIVDVATGAIARTEPTVYNIRLNCTSYQS